MSRIRIGIVLIIISVLAGWSLNARAQQPAPSSIASPSSSSAAPGSKTGASQKPAPSPAAQASPTQLPDVSITATRITQPVSQIGTTVTVINSQQMQDQKIQQTSDALRQVPGVQVTQSGGPGTETDVSIRGSGPSQDFPPLHGGGGHNGGA